jgi:hypothetical protein
MASQTKFVSSIPNNSLEPVYLGGMPSNDGPKSSGIFVPSCLKGEKNEPTVKVEKVPEFNEQSFPSLIGEPVKKPKAFLGYANAVKSPAANLVKSPPNNYSAASNVSKNPPKTTVTSNYDEYSDSDSDAYEEP